MTKENDTFESHGDDAVVVIGTLEVPQWQFNIYYTEAEKYLLELQGEVEAAKTTGVSKALVRDIHTLAGISNTLGAEQIARLGYAIEDWLTNIFEDRGSAALTSAELALLDMACQALSIMIERIRAKEPVLDERIDVLALLQEVDTKNHEKRMSASIEPETQPSGSDEDWLAKEMKSLEESLNFDVDPTEDWLTDLDVLSTNIDTAKSSITSQAPSDNIEIDVMSLLSDIEIPTITLDDLSISLPEPDAPVDSPIIEPVPVEQLPEVRSETFFEVHTEPLIIRAEEPPAQATSLVHELRDYRSYVADLLPGDDVQDTPEESIKDIFIEEATEIFDSLPDDIDAWSASRGHDHDKSNKIKRALHTLKGSSRMSGYFRFGVLVHNIETIMETSHSVLSSEEIPDLLQAVSDALVQELRHIKDSAQPSGLLKSAYENLEVYVAPATAAITPALSTNPVEQAPPSVPASAPPGPQTRIPARVAQGNKGNTVQEDANVNTVLRVPTEKIDVLANQLGRSGTIQLRVETTVSRVDRQILEMSTNLERLRKLLKEVEIQAESQMRSRLEEARRDNASFDPLEFDRFTRLQELTRMTAEAMHDIDNSHTEVLKGLSDIHDSMAENNVLAEDLQHAVMSVRTVPVKSLGRRLEMVIRQAALDTKKQAGLFLDSDVEVDSGILNKIATPLEHLIRNAIAHGIEKPEVRTSKGKNEKGTVTLQVRHRGNDTVFRLIDDGAGINRIAVEKRAREKGLVSPSEELTQDQANQMIFHPGFSTAEVVSELAGRGVGMDVVHDTISDMGGRIIINSEEGKGTTFELVIPSYMSVISMVPVRARDISYAVPSALVRDVIVTRDTKILEAYETGHLEIRETSYPFYGLSEASGAEAPEIQRNNRVMLLDDQQGIAAIHIDALEVDRNLVMKPLCRTIATLPGLLGASIAGDGSPLLVINPVQLRQSVQRQKRQFRRVEAAEPAIRTRHDMTVMVIDDSMTIRRITQKFLSRAGFKVVLAVDGLDAIEKISANGPADLYLTDIEMPHMDGFQLTEHIRTSVSKTAPIVMISSRSIEKYADHAKSLGVTKSLGKPYQEPELLAIIEELLGLKESNT